jgi:hypothetical protein
MPVASYFGAPVRLGHWPPNLATAAAVNGIGVRRNRDAGL